MKEKLIQLYNDVKLRRLLAIDIIVVASVMAFFLPGGEDLYRFYRPMAEGCLECGLNPWYASWIFFPLRFIPLRLLWPLWVCFSLSALFFLAEKLEVHPVVALLAFPTLGMVWLGQTDILIPLGLYLGLKGKNPALRGFGLLLASIKPQVSGIAILILLWHDRDRWKTLIIPGIVTLLTIIVWGVDWPLRWIEARPEIEMPVWGLATTFPYGLITYGAIFLFKEVKEQMTAALLATALAVPWFGVYSYVAFIPFIMPWWGLPLSYAWGLFIPAFGKEAMAYAWTFPLGLLIWFCWPGVKALLERSKGTSEKE